MALPRTAEETDDQLAIAYPIDACHAASPLRIRRSEQRRLRIIRERTAETPGLDMREEASPR